MTRNTEKIRAIIIYLDILFTRDHFPYLVGDVGGGGGGEGDGGAEEWKDGGGGRGEGGPQGFGDSWAEGERQ